MKIPPLDLRAQEEARRRWDRLTKPANSLGRLEDLAARIASMTGCAVPRVGRKVLFVAAADHGVAAEGVSAYPQAVTGQMVENFLRGGAAINVLARQAGAQVVVIDAGVIGPSAELRAGRSQDSNGVMRCGVRAGSGNLAREPAMSREEAEQILEAGMRIFREAHAARPVGMVGLGDMGIGNTTPAAALTAVLTGVPVAQVTGRGTGVGDGQLLRKVRVIERALALHRPDPGDPVGCLSAVGGLEIGCLAGITLAAAQARIPVMLDGFITTSAALLACRVAPAAGYLIASHRSVEPGHRVQLEDLGLIPLLDLDLRLGEGTGAALAFMLADSALRLLAEMATFDEAGVEQGPHEEGRSR
ncbi:MAG: nicotinate-nucleotide--dimethylbenzimidazole phosphoribosyltransferase [Candidatus Omnitrophica bacterium]|nr:nicotinate-nucleotide--dimethylbenzimidazole phosphoribosyltransferase [Candidatus Omnitrophota bacterium]